MKRWDRRGLEGLPLKLMIVSLLMSLSAPLVLTSLDSYQDEVGRSALRAEAAKIAAAATEVFTDGPGNVRTVEISVPALMGKMSMALEIGGPLNDTSSLSIRCIIDGQVVSTIYMDDPPVRLVTNASLPLSLGAGTALVVLKNQQVDDRTVVYAEVGP
jgi:hypothetical protein